MKRVLLGALIVAAAAILYVFVLRRPGAAPLAESRFLMDTVVTVSVAGLEEERARAAIGGAFEELERVDREMARVPGTPLWELNEAGGGPISPSLKEVLLASLFWARLTAGAFDPTVAPLLDLWDFEAGPHAPPGEGPIARAQEFMGWRKVALDPKNRMVDLAGTSLDLGGIAKGYALDRAVGALRAAGAENFVVNAGGDLFVVGTKDGKPWRIGIQDPLDPERLLKVVTPREGALVTSGDYERFFLWEGERYHHILDPRTGRPARGCRSVTVWTRHGTDADALATAAFVLGPGEGLVLLERLESVEGLIVDGEGAERATSGFSSVAPAAPSSRPDAAPPPPEAHR